MTDVDTLAEYVRESNAIEGIYAMPGDPSYDDHIEAVRYTTALLRGEVTATPLEIHTILMRSQPAATPGEYRTVDVRVGGERKLPWRDVSQAMANLLYRAGLGVADKAAVSEWAWNMHHEFEHIHPFIDGNGRTGRLWMNALRLARGLLWLTVYEDDRQAYYKAIRDWEAAR